jgi:hypothetical protein
MTRVERLLAAKALRIAGRMLFVVSVTLALGVLGAFGWPQVSDHDVGPHGYGSLAPMFEGCSAGSLAGFLLSTLILLWRSSRTLPPGDTDS